MKVFILKAKNEINGKEIELSSYAIKDYKYAVDHLRVKLIEAREELQKAEYSKDTDMTEILKGSIEVYNTKKGQYHETFELEPIKVYNYGF